MPVSTATTRIDTTRLPPVRTPAPLATAPATEDADDDDRDEASAPLGQWLRARLTSGVELLGFWTVIGLLLALVAVLYLVPAQQRLERQQKAQQEALEWLGEVQDENDRLEAESASLDDPYYVERLLREEYHWVPKDRLDRNNRIIPPDSTSTGGR